MSQWYPETVGFTITRVDITRPSPYPQPNPNSPQEVAVYEAASSHVCRINRGHSCRKQQRAHYSVDDQRGESSPAHVARTASPHRFCFASSHRRRREPRQDWAMLIGGGGVVSR